jgi:hypothetical protein
MADAAASRVSYNMDDKIIASGYYSDNYGLVISGELRRGWINTYCSRVSLIEEALTNCITNNLDEEEVEYDEHFARFLLQSRGNVDIVDFLLDGVDPREYDDHGWGINI